MVLGARGGEAGAIAGAGRRGVDWWWVASTVGLAMIWLTFAWVHLHTWLTTGAWTGLGLVIQETVTAALFTVRRPARGTSRSWLAWLAAPLGTFGMLAGRPAYDPIGGLEPLYVVLQLVGAGVAIAGLWALGRSFGLVAANRGIKTGGPYALVRHPLYASYMLGYLAYLLENPSLRNLVVVLFTICWQLVRIGQEEAFLSGDPAYRAYASRVRYRLVPYLY